MAVARAKGKPRGSSPKLSDRQQQEPRRLHDSGDYSISALAELFSVSRPTVYRTLHRQAGRAAVNSTFKVAGDISPPPPNSTTERRSSAPFRDKATDHLGGILPSSLTRVHVIRTLSGPPVPRIRAAPGAPAVTASAARSPKKVCRPWRLSSYALLPMVVVNGLIANDKFCVSRVATPVNVVPVMRCGASARRHPDESSVEVHFCGGCHETTMADSSADDGVNGRPAAMGSALPMAAGVEPTRDGPDRFTRKETLMRAARVCASIRPKQVHQQTLEQQLERLRDHLQGNRV